MIRFAGVLVLGFVLSMTQACSSLGNDEGIVETPTSSTYLELRSGCTV